MLKKAVRRRVSVDCSVDVPLTAKNNRVQQNKKDSTDINFIVGKYIREHGHAPRPEEAGGFFSDVSDVGDFANVMERVLKGQELFSGLDARIRDRFHNSPGEFMEFASDTANHDAVMEFAFGVKPPVDEPKAVEGKETKATPAVVPDEAPKPLTRPPLVDGKVVS